MGRYERKKPIIGTGPGNPELKYDREKRMYYHYYSRSDSRVYLDPKTPIETTKEVLKFDGYISASTIKGPGNLFSICVRPCSDLYPLRAIICDNKKHFHIRSEYMDFFGVEDERKFKLLAEPAMDILNSRRGTWQILKEFSELYSDIYSYSFTKFFKKLKRSKGRK